MSNGAQVTGDGFPGGASVPVTVLRLDRPELDGTRLVVRAVDVELRERRRGHHLAPLGYLYDRADHDELESDLILDAGHYDAGDQTWSFSAEVPGIIGLTEPLSSADNPPAERVGKEGDQT
ncbi:MULTISPECIES: hypothetical protein [Micromonospora]|uniref:Uncharacterized protein n=1 Tax=Micromonospora gifhornensis TaxID=84594 RepID=A0ABQ4IM48_9ACTN|nr:MULTISPECIES: hypothetical protein [Micromonospora]AEB46804.1 hypothetical protein VAB18032_28666 [Micromonospora maris AB-18-032]GIJ18989.1 hypothetical protein Vgi01_56730 [Micromonospora gifhornensis]